MLSNAALDWFRAVGWEPFPFQIEVWEAYLNGESGLIHAPTGTGKTYAAWLGPIMDWLNAHPDHTPGTLKKRSNAAPLQVLWITPLRALASDTAQALQSSIEALGLPWTIETRTGDTSSSARNRQRTRLPTALVTTPESLSLLLARDNARDLFASLRVVIVDEWHELMASKRGVQVELALARLRGWSPDLRTWGLSATIGNLDVALRALIGMVNPATGEVPAGRIIRARVEKVRQIDSILPQNVGRFPWAGHLGLKLLPDVIAAIEASRTTLVFTNTRSQTEAWFQAILDARPEWAGEMALHHSALDAKTRDWVENALRQRSVRCVVCTSSLDLGVDFPPVDRVLQISSPKGAARLLQRAGRSGHRPGAVSRVTCVPAHAFELVEVAAAREAIERGEMEARPPVRCPLDVLVQHLVTVGLGGGFEPESLLREVRSTYAFHDLSRDDWHWALDFVARGGDALKAYPEYRRVQDQEGRFVVTDETIARLHRLSIGTILGDATLQVQYLKGGKIGHIEESFAERLKRGDRFTLAGKVLEFVRLHEMTVWVRRARTNKGVIPRWSGGSLPLSEVLTEGIRRQIDQARRGLYQSPEMDAVRPVLDLQAKWSALPGWDDLLTEQIQTREGHHLFVYPFAGRLAHEGIAALAAYRLSRLQPITFTIAVNDYGFELLAAEPFPFDDAIARATFSADALAEDILASLNAGEMARRQFREVARISGLVIQRFPGGQKSARQIQASSGLIYDVLAKYDPDNLLLRQAQIEVLDRQLEQTRLKSALDRIASANRLIRQPPRPTPFAFPLLVERLRQTVSSETLEDRIARMLKPLEKEADRP